MTIPIKCRLLPEYQAKKERIDDRRRELYFNSTPEQRRERELRRIRSRVTGNYSMLTVAEAEEYTGLKCRGSRLENPYTQECSRVEPKGQPTFIYFSGYELVAVYL